MKTYLTDFSGIAQAQFITWADKVRWGVWSSEEYSDCIYGILKECQGGV